MEGIRKKRITALIHKEIAEILRYEIDNQEKLISVSKVYMSAGLESAKIYLSIFPITQKEKVLSHITEKLKHYKNLLAKRVRHHLRKVPDLNFYLDNSLNDLENIDRELYGGGENPIKF